MPVVNTIKQALQDFSDQKAAVIQTRGHDTTVYPKNGHETTSTILLIFNNVQHFLKQRDLRIGQENSMMIGIAATYVELEVQAAACDVMDKCRCIVENQPKDLTVDQILGLLDQPHFKIVGVLQWLEALTKNIPQLACYKSEVSLHYRTHAAKLQMPIEKSKIHPLATSGKNEANIGDLKDSFIDFLEQLRQKEGDYDFRL
jgi:hypothetical protein